MPVSKRPCGPFGGWNVHSCSANFGASPLATAQALGEFMMRALWPEISALLFEASFHAKTVGGKNGTAFLNHSSTCLVASDLTVILPSSSSRRTPWAANIVPTQLTASGVVLIGMP